MAEWKKMVAELLDIDEGLKAWEIRFIESIEKLPSLSASQFVKLEDIWHDRIG